MEDEGEARVGRRAEVWTEERRARGTERRARRDMSKFDVGTSLIDCRGNVGRNAIKVVA
jgi:hypothetical protein